MVFERRLPGKYVARVVDLHYNHKLTYEQIVRSLVNDFTFCTTASIKKTLQRWRKDNNVQSYQVVAKRINEQLIAHYESVGCKISMADLTIWANEHCKRADDSEWKQSQVRSVLCDWRIRTGRMSQRQLRQMGTWDRIHELLTTGHTCSMVAEKFNGESYQLFKGKPWTTEAVKVFHSKYSRRYNVDLTSTAYRSEQECLEIAFLASMWRVDDYDAPQIVDRLNEQKLYWYHGRPWRRGMLNNVIYRARSILREIEGARAMSAIIDDRDTRVITAAAMAAVGQQAQPPQLQVVHPDGDDTTAESIGVAREIRKDKLERLSRCAYRIAEMRDEGARTREIRAELDATYPRPGGWDSSAIEAVERYGQHAVTFQARERDPVVMESLSERVHRLRGAYSHAQIATILNDDSTANEISPGQEWREYHVVALLKWRATQAKNERRRGKRKQHDSTDGPSQLERVLGRRKMRPADVAIRELARSKLAMKDAAFARATEIHAQIEELNRQLAQANHEVSEALIAEQLLIETGPKQLVSQLNSAKITGISNSQYETQEALLVERQIQVEELTQRICHEDWR